MEQVIIVILFIVVIIIIVLIEQVEAALSILLAAGFSVQLAWIVSKG